MPSSCSFMEETEELSTSKSLSLRYISAISSSSSSSLMVAQDSALKLFNERGNGGIFGVKEKDLLGGDDGLDVFQVDDDGSFTAQNG
nr:hypothetical protein D0Y65_015309 [Ipomoea trifida]